MVRISYRIWLCCMKCVQCTSKKSDGERFTDYGHQGKLKKMMANESKVYREYDATVY